MAINKVVYGTTVLVDLSEDTVTADKLATGITAHDKAGNIITGTKKDPTFQSKTVSPSTSAQTVKPDSGYDGLSQVTVNAMATATQATPSISVDANGLITASAKQTEGYVAEGTKSNTKQLTTKAATTITPSASAQTAVAAEVYTTGVVTVAGDANLVADNIKSGTSIFGVIGTYEGKVAGGSSIENCEVTFDGHPLHSLYYTFVDNNGKAVGVGQDFDEYRPTSFTIKCIQGSVLFALPAKGYKVNCTNASVLEYVNTMYPVIKIDDNASTAMIKVVYDGGSGD